MDTSFRAATTVPSWRRRNGRSWRANAGDGGVHRRGACSTGRLIGWDNVHLRRRSLDVLLAIVAIVSAAAVLLSHEDPFVRIAVCTHTGFCPTFAHAKAGYKVLYDLGISALVSLVFYLLVVRLPDYQRRQRLKRSLSAHYKAFRKAAFRSCLALSMA